MFVSIGGSDAEESPLWPPLQSLDIQMPQMKLAWFLPRLFVPAVLINYVWEVVQAPLYVGMENFNLVWWHCGLAALGDGLLVLLIYAVGWAVFVGAAVLVGSGASVGMAARDAQALSMTTSKPPSKNCLIRHAVGEPDPRLILIINGFNPRILVE